MGDGAGVSSSALRRVRRLTSPAAKVDAGSRGVSSRNWLSRRRLQSTRYLSSQPGRACGLGWGALLLHLRSEPVALRHGRVTLFNQAGMVRSQAVALPSHVLAGRQCDPEPCCLAPIVRSLRRPFPEAVAFGLQHAAPLLQHAHFRRRRPELELHRIVLAAQRVALCLQTAHRRHPVQDVEQDAQADILYSWLRYPHEAAHP